MMNLFILEAGVMGNGVSLKLVQHEPCRSRRGWRSRALARDLAPALQDVRMLLTQTAPES